MPLTGEACSSRERRIAIQFCPYCANLLRFREDPLDNRFACPTCPYIYTITAPVIVRTYFTGKKRADIYDAESALMGMQTTEERCPKCSHPRAYFKQQQTRSADEPMTTLYKCCNHACAHTWRVD